MARAVFGSPCNIRHILVHNIRGVRAELERDAAKSHRLMKRLPDRNAAGEGEHADALVRGEETPDLAALAVDEIQAPRRKPRLLKHIAEKRCRERRCRGGLVDDGIARRKGRADLVRCEIDGEVERGDRADNAERAADRKCHAPCTARRSRKRHRLTTQTLCLLCREDERLIGAVDLAARVADGFSRLGRKRLRKLLAALAHEICRPHEDLITFIGTELHFAESPLCRICGCPHLGLSRRTNRCDLLPRRLVTDGQRALPRNICAANEHFDRLHFIVLPPQAVPEPRRPAENHPESSSSALPIEKEPRAAHVSCFSL